MADNLRNTLIRVYTMDLRACHGNVVVAEVLRRRVMVRPLAKPGTQHDLAGAVLIDQSAALNPIGTNIQAGVGFLVLIRATDELIWVPTRADMMAGADYWTIEMVPWVEYARASMEPDDEILRKAHQL